VECASPAAALIAGSAVAGALLQPPNLIGKFEGHSQLRIQVQEDLHIHLLEADVEQQEQLVNAALHAPSFTADEDPYGAVLWPAAQVVASAATAEELQGKTVLELGAGTGLCSLAAAAAGARVLATDYREEPLRLLQKATLLNNQVLGRTLKLETKIFDMLDEATLPIAPDVLLAADLLYYKHTAQALARRCVEALQNGCELVLVGDCGRPGHQAFLEMLHELPVRDSAVYFSQVDGWSSGSIRHDLIAPDDGGKPHPKKVGLLILRPGDLL